MPHYLTANVFCNDFNTNLHGCSTCVIYGGEKGNHLADMDRLAKHDLINGQCHHVLSSITACTSVGDLIQEFQYNSPMHVA